MDELLFEYHFYFDGLNFGWYAMRVTSPDMVDQWIKDHKPDVDDALKLMHKLRAAGIRSHFWI